MKLGAYTAVLHDRPIAEALTVLRDLGLESAEVNSGGFLPAPHLPIAALAVGRGHDLAFWTRSLAALQAVDPDMAVNIEHEDAAYSRTDGLALAAETLRSAAAKV